MLLDGSPLAKVQVIETNSNYTNKTEVDDIVPSTPLDFHQVNQEMRKLINVSSVVRKTNASFTSQKIDRSTDDKRTKPVQIEEVGPLDL